MKRRAFQLNSRSIHKVNREGFTLLELLTVVAIVSILASVAIISFQKYQQKAKMLEASIVIDAISDAQIGFYSRPRFSKVDGRMLPSCFCKLYARPALGLGNLSRKTPFYRRNIPKSNDPWTHIDFGLAADKTYFFYGAESTIGYDGNFRSTFRTIPGNCRCEDIDWPNENRGEPQPGQKQLALYGIAKDQAGSPNEIHVFHRFLSVSASGLPSSGPIIYQSVPVSNGFMVQAN